MRRLSNEDRALRCNTPEQACAGKLAYPNATLAHRHARGLGKRHESRGEPRVYRCDYCGQWHVAGNGRRRA